ncbi:MAG: transporter substrate-binding domain-containing protein [Syntrophorhabdales bacterium]
MGRLRLIRTFIFVLFFVCLLPPPAHPQRVLRAGIDAALPPFSFIDPGTNAVRGFNIDLVKLLAANMKAKVKFFSVEGGRMEEYVKDGRVDLIVGEKAGERVQSLELPIQVERKLFVNNRCVTITCVRDLPGSTVVVLSGSNFASLIPAWKKVRFIEAESQEKALQLVDEGKADAYISPNGRAAVYAIQKGNLRNIKEVGMPVDLVPLAVSVRADNTQLLTELSVAFGKIVENGGYETICKKWFGHQVELADVEKYVKVGAVIAGLLAVMLFGSMIWNRSLKRRVLRVTRDLQLSEQRHKDLVEFSPEMIHLIAADGRIIDANKIAVQRLGYSREETCSMRVGDIVAPERRHEVEEFIASVFAMEAGAMEAGKKELTLCATGGGRIEVEMSATVVRMPDMVLACCFSRDITERKHLEEELIQSERLAIMGEMAAGIAHEINNPLGIILANTEELVQQNAGDGETKESLQAIERNAVRAGKFIDDLLTFTRPSAPTKARIDLATLVEESLSLCKQQLRQKQIEVEKAFTGAPLFFEGDDSQIQQVVVNLVLNAIQAMPGKGKLRVRAGRGDDDGVGSIRLEIADSGMGIPEKDLAKIFDPFYTARKNKGFGLGLSISKRIIEKHNGTVRVESEEGRGTVIYIDLPACPSTEAMERTGREGSLG